MGRILLIAWREFKATAMTKAFVFGAVVLPVGIIGVLAAAGAAGLFSQQAEPLKGRIAIYDSTDGQRMTEAVAGRFDPEALKAEMEAQRRAAIEMMQRAGAALGSEEMTKRAESMIRLPEVADEVEIERAPADASLDALKERVSSGELKGLVHISPDSMVPGGSFELFLADNVKGRDIRKIEARVADAIVDQRYADMGLNPGQMRGIAWRPSPVTRTVTDAGETSGTEEILEFVPLVMIMLLAMGIFTGGGYLLMSTVEEKSSRIMEVLLSAVSPGQLMTGKIIGQGMVGLLTLGLYSAAGIAAAIQFEFWNVIPPTLLLWLAVYFLMGYFMFAAIHAAIGAAVNDVREAQALQGPVMGVTILAMYLSIFSAMFNPHSPLTRALSFFPPVTPFVMSMRVAQVGDPVPAWELAATTVVGALGAVLAVWAAAKVFRVGVLMYGQPPTIMGLIKWIRYA